MQALLVYDEWTRRNQVDAREIEQDSKEAWCRLDTTQDTDFAFKKGCVQASLNCGYSVYEDLWQAWYFWYRENASPNDNWSIQDSQ